MSERALSLPEATETLRVSAVNGGWTVSVYQFDRGMMEKEPAVFVTSDALAEYIKGWATQRDAEAQQ